MKKLGSEAKRGGATILSKQKIYSKIAQRSDEIIDGLFELSKSRNESVKLGATKVLLNKILPDLRSIELPIETEEKEYEISDGLSSIIKKFCDKDLERDYLLLKDEFKKRTGIDPSEISEELKRRQQIKHVYE